MCNVYAMRLNLSVAMVSMVNTTVIQAVNASDHAGECRLNNQTETGNTHDKNDVKTSSKEHRVYNWDSKTQGHVMSAFFYGYVVTVLTGGYLSERFGSTTMFGTGILVTSFLTLLTPVVLDWGVVPFLVLRAMEGIAEGVTLPAVSAIISHWSPKQERSRFTAVTFSGVSVGSIVALSVSGWLCSTDFLGGWPSVFYVFGFLGLFWVVFWCIFISESPSTHPNISEKELQLIVGTHEEHTQSKVSAFPWMKLITSLPAWAVLVTHVGNYFASNIIHAYLPLYLSRVLDANVETSGLMSGLPNICEWLGCCVTSVAADALLKSERFSRTTVRKICNSLALFGAGSCVLLFTVSKCSLTAVVTLLCINLFLSSLKYSGFCVTHVDMCAPVAGTFFGITNGIACLTGIIGPHVVAAFTESGDTLENWSYVFYVTAVVQFGTGTFYALFASAEPQPWLSSESPEKEPKTEKT